MIQTWSSFAKDNIGELLEGSSNQLKLSLQKISASMDELREILSDMNGLMQKAEKFIEQVRKSTNWKQQMGCSQRS